MLLLSPLVPCGVPKRGGQTKSPRKTSEFGDSPAGWHGERNISQETQEREQASQLPLRCIRATEYFRGTLREKRVEAKVYLRGSLRPQCGSTGRKGGTTLSAFEALGIRLSQKVSMFFNL